MADYVQPTLENVTHVGFVRVAEKKDVEAAIRKDFPAGVYLASEMSGVPDAWEVYDSNFTIVGFVIADSKAKALKAAIATYKERAAYVNKSEIEGRMYSIFRAPEQPAPGVTVTPTVPGLKTPGGTELGSLVAQVFEGERRYFSILSKMPVSEIDKREMAAIGMNFYGDVQSGTLWYHWYWELTGVTPEPPPTVAVAPEIFIYDGDGSFIALAFEEIEQTFIPMGGGTLSEIQLRMQRRFNEDTMMTIQVIHKATGNILWTYNFRSILIPNDPLNPAWIVFSPRVKIVPFEDHIIKVIGNDASMNMTMIMTKGHLYEGTLRYREYPQPGWANLEQDLAMRLVFI